MAINILDRNTINKIAAGEVVERPSSVVKELVENAIDAGATAITVEIKDGGISLIRVTDNGCGIAGKEVKIAFMRHSTSKIKDAADLLGISSLGFRGEALSSISAVSQVELITKRSDELSGTRYRIDGGAEKGFEEVGAPDGSTFLVRNLFYNTPARRKFLKTPATEAGYISSVIEHLCMSHPDISFRFINNNQPKLQTVGNGSLKDVIYAVYGRDIASNLIEIDRVFDSFKIKGYIGKPVICRGNRNYENYYINGRYIKSPIVAKAVEEAYAPYIMQHKYPFTSFHITIEPELLDVNVHPSKMELRFANGPYIFDSVKKALSDALTGRELIVDASVDYKAPAAKPLPGIVNFTGAKPVPDDFVPHKPLSGHSKENGQRPLRNLQTGSAAVTSGADEHVIPETDKSVTPAADERPQKPERMPEPFETRRAAVYDTESLKPHYEQLELFERPELLKEENKKDIRIVGQVFDTYWIIEFEKNMYIIDQHAAHEKVLFERFMKRYDERKITTQYLSPPVIFSVTMQEDNILSENMDYFVQSGFEIESFGGSEYAVRGIPADFSAAKPEELLLEILDELVTDTKKATPDTIKDKIATMSCKAAVKGNNRLSEAEAKELISELMELDNPYNCPHGRPTMITISKYELEKKFKRII